MDAIEFLVEKARMCRSCNFCKVCPAYENFTCGFNELKVRTKEQAQRLVQLVCQWAAEHPRETRWTRLKEQYPNMNDNAKYSVCAKNLGYECESCDLTDCKACWDTPIED